MSTTTKQGTTVTQNGTPFIIGKAKSGISHIFDMVLTKHWSKVPRAIIATLSDYTVETETMRDVFHITTKHSD